MARTSHETPHHLHRFPARLTRPAGSRHLSDSYLSPTQALTPLFTVLSFRILFSVAYPMRTYAALAPLTLGVMMACTGMAFSPDDLLGLSAALASTLVFVANNIFSKKVLSKSGSHGGDGEKSDKYSVLYYSSGISVVVRVTSRPVFGLSLMLHPDHAALCPVYRCAAHAGGACTKPARRESAAAGRRNALHRRRCAVGSSHQRRSALCPERACFQ